MPPTTAGRFRVLDSPREDDEWIFLSVDGEADAGDPGTENSNRNRHGHGNENGSRNANADADGDGDGPYEPIYVPKRGHGDRDELVGSLLPGYLVEATLTWETKSPRVTDVEVLKRSLFEFVDDATNIFEAAEATWSAPAATGDAMNSQVTYSTDGDPNGVLYVFAEQSGALDLFEEFCSGERPLEPLIERVNEAAPRTRDRTGPGVAPDGTIAVPTPDDSDGSDDNPDPDHGLGRDREVFVMRPAAQPFVIVYIVLRKGGLLADTMRDTYHCPRPEETV